MKKKVFKQNNVVIYQTSNGSIEFRGDFSHETIWATQAQIAEVFGVTSQNITMHVKNIYRERELEESATCKEFLQVQIEGNRSVKRNIKEYNLDVIIAVGYRINSVVGTQFRKWATKKIREYITKGFAINKRQIKKNHQEFLKAIESIQIVEISKSLAHFTWYILHTQKATERCFFTCNF